MTGDLNRVLVTGVLVSDPRLLKAASGETLCVLRLDVHSYQRDLLSGRARLRFRRFEVVSFGGLAELCFRGLRETAHVAIDGWLLTRSWEDVRGWHRWTGVVAQQMQFLRRASVSS